MSEDKHSKSQLTTPDTSAASSRATTPTSVARETIPDGKSQDDGSKFRTFLSILKRFIGVSDLAAVRFSLPAQLLEPIPNLEYWHYLDRPETLAAIGDSEDELERMLGCLRFWLTKDLKYVHGKPCKPYNSTLGEFFRCQWDVEDAASSSLTNGHTSSDGADLPVAAGSASVSSTGKHVKVNYLTEQTSHHPPVSAWYAEVPEKGISARGFDQLAAKFTGTSIRVVPGEFNEGIFVTLHNRDQEEYKLTHPAAYLGGFIRGNLNITVSDHCYITCAKTGLRAILHYVEEGYFGKTQNKVQGVIYKCDPANDIRLKAKDVPEKDIIGRIEGSWTEQIYFTKGSTEFKKVLESERILLIDVSQIRPVPKSCPPDDQQLPNESRRFWGDVTDSIKSKQYSTATSQKTVIEEKQRERAAQRKAENKEWQPRFFTAATGPNGRPELTEEGRKALNGLQDSDYHLDEPAEYGAL